MVEAGERLQRNEEEAWRQVQLVRMRQDQQVRIAARDLLDIDDVVATGQELTALHEALLEAALAVVGPAAQFAVIGMGRFGGAEMSYASDLDVLLVYDGVGAEAGEVGAEFLVHFMRGPSPAQRVAALDLGLRPEGGQGRLARDVRGYTAYFERWAETWERQALVRARVVAGSRDLGERFMAVAGEFVWDRPFTEADVAAIRRMKARIERERISPREDPQFHLKLGRGSLSDIEWTVQLLQLRHRVPGTSTIAALETLGGLGILPPATWRHCATPTASANGPGIDGTSSGRSRGARPPATRCPPRPTSCRDWPGASAPRPHPCATTIAGSPDEPGRSWSGPSTASRAPDRVRAPRRPASSRH